MAIDPKLLPAVYWRCPLCHTVGTISAETHLFHAPKLRCSHCTATWEVRDTHMTLLEPPSSVPVPAGAPTNIDAWYALGAAAPLPLTPVQTPVLLKKGEQAYLFHAGAGLYQEKVVRRRIGGRTGGVSVRVAKGVYVHSGGFSGQSVPVKETTQVATGHLTLTNRRLVFTGGPKAVDIPLKDLAEVQIGGGHLHVAYRSKMALLGIPGDSLTKWREYIMACARQAA